MKTMLITGASSGIGKSLAIEALNNGFKVIGCGRNNVKLSKISGHPNFQPICFDMNHLHDCQKHLQNLSPNIIVLNAGTCEYVDAEKLDVELFRRVFEANVISQIAVLSVLLPQLKTGSQVVFVDSLARLLPFTRSQAYGGSKAALHYIAKSLEVDLISKGI